MTLRQEVLETPAGIADRLTDEAAGLRIEVLRKGAELLSIARRDSRGTWVGFLHRDGDASEPASGWKNHSTVMGYYIHRLKGERSMYAGEEIKGGTHGLLRHHQFGVPERTDRGVAYKVGPGEYPADAYPRRVSCRITYELDAGSVVVRFEFENQESGREAHVSFGLHPGFAATSLAECRVILPPGRYTRHLAPGNFLSGERVTFVHEGGDMPFSKTDLPGSFLLEPEDLKEGAILFDDPQSGRVVSLDFTNVPYLTLWSDGGDFVCIEPCWGLPDHHDQRPFEKKEGIQTIPAGGTLNASFRVTPMLKRE